MMNPPRHSNSQRMTATTKMRCSPSRYFAIGLPQTNLNWSKAIRRLELISPIRLVSAFVITGQPTMKLADVRPCIVPRGGGPANASPLVDLKTISEELVKRKHAKVYSRCSDFLFGLNSMSRLIRSGVRVAMTFCSSFNFAHGEVQPGAPQHVPSGRMRLESEGRCWPKQATPRHYPAWRFIHQSPLWCPSHRQMRGSFGGTTSRSLGRRSWSTSAHGWIVRSRQDVPN